MLFEAGIIKKGTQNKRVKLSCVIVGVKTFQLENIQGA